MNTNQLFFYLHLVLFIPYQQNQSIWYDQTGSGCDELFMIVYHAVLIWLSKTLKAIKHLHHWNGSGSHDWQLPCPQRFFFNGWDFDATAQRTSISRYHRKELFISILRRRYHTVFSEDVVDGLKVELESIHACASLAVFFRCLSVCLSVCVSFMTKI